MSIRKVHVVCKTHLDIGFTDFAGNVVNHYVHKYIPAAIRMAEEVNEGKEHPLFIWTVGSYLIDYALRTCTGDELANLDAAIRKGYITYHAMPFTTHSELCDPALFDAGLGITKRLDARYGRHTIAAKMTDVPGHTVGIVHPLVKQGVQFLHIGINDVACMVDLPPVFVWENGKGERLLVNYVRSYGGLTVIDGHDEALYFLHGNDNMSPPSKEILTETFAKLQGMYPDAVVTASTLDAFAQGLVRMRDTLPLVRDEIGDTWIHGIGCDPKKTSMLRALSRLSARWDADGTWARYTQCMADGRMPREAFLEMLLLVCEHTWGLDTKKYLTDFKNWNREDFDEARLHDKLEDRYGDVPGYEDAFTFGKREFEKLRPDDITWGDRSYSLFEASHAEQRAYIREAVALLPEDLQEVACNALDTETFGKVYAEPGHFALVQNSDGSVVLTHKGGPALSIQPPLYQETGLDNYTRLVEQYLDHMEVNRDWAIPDNCKPGAEYGDAPKADVNHRPVAVTAPEWRDGAWHLEGRFPEGPVLAAGCPERFGLTIQPVSDDAALLTVSLMDKPANRKPESIFLPLEVPGAVSLRMKKIDAWVDAKQCASRSNERTHGVQELLFSKGKESVSVVPLDTPLVSIDRPEILFFDKPERYERVYAALFNNLWGTNFKMWYEEDMVCRFLITFGKEEILHEA